jgi:hypothetical protein
MQDTSLETFLAAGPATGSAPPTFVAGTQRSAAALHDWASARAPQLRALLRRSGALLLRGFELTQPGDFASIASSNGGPLGEHYEGPSPRTELAPGVYTASEVSPAVVVPEHAEMSYLQQMPRYLFFWCRAPARHGGGTPVVDARRVLQKLDPERIAPLLPGLRIRRRHARPSGWHDPFELKRWPLSFGTEERELLQARAQALGFTAHFERDGALTLEHEQPAVRSHPETAESAWLNHLLVFHASSPAALLRSAVLRDRSLRALPMLPVAAAYRALAARAGYAVASDVRLRDGAPIAESTVEHVRSVVEREASVLAWQRGDLLVVDNHLFLHGRRPFRGAREVIVAWSAARA